MAVRYSKSDVAFQFFLMDSITYTKTEFISNLHVIKLAGTMGYDIDYHYY